jgi:hypothetical protein
MERFNHLINSLDRGFRCSIGAFDTGSEPLRTTHMNAHQISVIVRQVRHRLAAIRPT